MKLLPRVILQRNAIYGAFRAHGAYPISADTGWTERVNPLSSSGLVVSAFRAGCTECRVATWGYCKFPGARAVEIDAFRHINSMGCWCFNDIAIPASPSSLRPELYDLYLLETLAGAYEP